ncbi:hypothetical protein [Azonexus sp. R2A61]|uniref:hypothetical protein n=1 Tax=Azonexus sp. R2A61 TaxID=2744443 RepID=UPI001F45702E|nr:hypothetical protein [Azonexus sp. R2A61]
MISLTANGTTLPLDGDLYWSDEFDWSPIEQSITYSADGALLIDEFERQTGRPITLRPFDDASAWMPRATLLQLQSWAGIAELTMTLMLRSTSYSVMFRRDEGSPITAEPVVFVSDAVAGDAGDYYLITLRLIEI